MMLHTVMFLFQIDFNINTVPGVTIREGSRVILCEAKNHQSLQPSRGGMNLVRALEPLKHSSTEETLTTRCNSKQQITQVT